MVEFTYVGWALVAGVAASLVAAVVLARRLAAAPSDASQVGVPPAEEPLDGASNGDRGDGAP